MYLFVYVYAHNFPFFIFYFLFYPYQVLGKSLRITTNYLNTEEKAVVANSKLESIEAKSSKLKKDLIAVIDEMNKENEKIKELTEALCMEKALIIQKDEEI